MKKLKLYLDTSIINWAVSDDPKRAEEKEETLKVIEKINNGEYEGYISELVIAEINKTPDEKHRETLQKYLNEIDVNVIAESEESDELANKYVKEDIIPQKHYNDAVHIALASINNIDVIVSWNFEHMVKIKTKRGVKAVNGLMGYKDIEIAEPKEV